LEEEASMLLGILAVPLLLLVSALGAEAQQVGEPHRIGVISIGGPRTPAFDALLRPMIEQLRADGWVEGQSIALEYRFDEGKRERLAALIAELVDLKVKVIVAISTPAALAAKRGTATIPIVMIRVGDPVRSGLVASLQRPGGNVTGMALLGPEVTSKQVELLKEAVPHARTLGVLFDALNPAQASSFADSMPAATAATGLELHPIKAEASEPLTAAFAEARAKRCDALLVWPLTRTAGWIREAADLATKHRLPTLGMFRSYAEQGMLMSYAPRDEEQFQRAATYVNRILRGREPRDLSIEQPTLFDFVVNVKTATALGLTLPPALLLRADQLLDR
jgi:putative ABC transport system substrate-binding protein